jgi:hypothetical protein
MKKIYFAAIATLIANICCADGNRLPGTIPPIAKQECASCHTLYPPAFLPVESWKRIMANLEKHYGTDASTDAKSNLVITQWLTQYGGTYKRISGTPPGDRITASPWFIKKHNGVSAGTWKNPKIKSASNCVACHTGANEGNYDDESIVLPK